MRKSGKHLNRYRVDHPTLGLSPRDTLYGCFEIHDRREPLRVISGGERTGDDSQDLTEWEHVSVSLPHRCPTWVEMCYVKDLFWLPTETVIQFHPSRLRYVNAHPTCLHLWRNPNAEIELPPTWTLADDGGKKGVLR